MSLRAMIVAAAVLTSGTACRMFDAAALSRRPPLSPDVLSALELQLRRDAWQRNPRWSLLDTTAAGQPLDSETARDRWRFATPVVDEIVSILDDRAAAKDVPPRNSEPAWSGWTAESPGETLWESGIEPRGGTRYLAALAEVDGIVGWNAAILWALRAPESAGEVAPLLEQLVTNPPYYNPATGKRAAAPETPAVPSEPAGVPAGSSPGPSQSSNIEDDPRVAELLRKHQPKAGAGTEGSAFGSATIYRWWKRWEQKLGGGPAAASQARKISPLMQSAAAEAWCRVLVAGSRDPRVSLYPAGRLLKRVSVPNTVRAELYRGVARWVRPVEIPRLDNALRERRYSRTEVPVEVRRAAIDACLLHALEVRRRGDARSRTNGTPAANRYAADAWPETIPACQNDSDPRVRETFGRWAAVAGHPDAVEILERQFLDTDSRVRHGALLSLGMSGTAAARRRLRARAARGDDSDRAQAIKGLAYWGVAELDRYTDEKSDPIRKAVAVSLADYPSVRSGRILQRYLEGAGEHVQIAAVRATARWPDEMAIPVLLHAMGQGTGRAADAAYRLLVRRERNRGTQFDAMFSSSDIQPVRARAVEALAFRYNLNLDWDRKLSRERSGAGEDVNPQFEREIGADLAALAGSGDPHRRRRALERLRRISSDDVGLVERLAIESKQSYPDALYFDVLAQHSRPYQALKNLYHEDPLVQRRGAQALAHSAVERPLSRLIVRRMLHRLRARRDRVLWNWALRAVMRDASPECDQLATEAAFHAAPTVRVLACDYFARHPHPRKSDILLQLMNDEDDRQVRLAAIRAAGFARNPELITGRRIAPPEAAPAKRNEPAAVSPRRPAGRTLLGLQQLMVAYDRSIRHAAVVALVRMGDDLGYRELTRMTYSQSAELRREAFALMGESGRRRFVDLLIERGWGERDPAARAAILRSLDEIIPPEERPVGLSSAKRYDAQIELWAKSRQAASRSAANSRVNRNASDRRNLSNGRKRPGFSTRMAWKHGADYPDR